NERVVDTSVQERTPGPEGRILADTAGRADLSRLHRHEYSLNPAQGTGDAHGTYVVIPLADAASGHPGRGLEDLGSIREPNADKLFYQDGAGLPPQGRTVRAAPALPP